MEIVVTETSFKMYTNPLIPGWTDPMWTAIVKFPEHGVTMGLSHRGSDPDGMWLADWRIEANGMVNFSHGDGDRSCKKQIAGAKIVRAIGEAQLAAAREQYPNADL